MKYFSRKLAIVVGINQYGHGIAKLQTAVQDARALADTLRKEHGYQVTELIDGSANLATLRDLFEKKLPQMVTDQDCLLVYFAGHGIAKQANEKATESGTQETEGPVGYLIPQDARPEDEGTFWSMQAMYRAVEKLPCRHFLLILDCCFAGAFRWATTRDVLVPEIMYKERFLRFKDQAAWQVLTSASYDQKALDILRDNRGLAHGDHSPFAAALIEALTGSEADITKDKIITATELYLHLRDFVEIHSKERQTPGLWPLPKHDRGEYFFLTKEFNEEGLDKAPELNPENNPYRGLKAYESRHGHLFFGRDRLITRLYRDYVRPNGLTVVVGASGTGKSSLVKAGLVAYLTKAAFLERRPDFNTPEAQVSEAWEILPMVRPSNDPLLALAQALFPLGLESLSPEDLTAVATFDGVVLGKREAIATLKVFSDLWQPLADKPKDRMVLALAWEKSLEPHLDKSALQRLTALTKRASESVQRLKATLLEDETQGQALLQAWLSQRPQTQVLWVIDQAEELITQCRDEVARQRFMDYLEWALTTHSGQLHGVLTVRMDFEPLVKGLFSPAWQTEWTERYRLVVPPMTQDDLRQAIEGPANEKALYFDPASLVDDLINEVVQMPGALPLLSFVLSELYLKCVERWREEGDTKRALTEKDYIELDKVSGALRHRANAEFNALDEAGQRTLRNIMLRMVALEGGELARRRVPRTELVYADAAENQRVDVILNRLIEQRLLVSGRSAEGEYVEPAHDVLVRGWEKIAEWLKEEVEVQPIVGFWQSLWLLRAIARQSNIVNQVYRQGRINLTLQRQLSLAAVTWKNIYQAKGVKKGKEYLWVNDPRLPLLRQVQTMEEHYWLNKDEINFVQESIKQERINNRKLLTTGLTVVSAISLTAIVAFWQRGIALRNSELALARQLAAESQALYLEDPNLLELSSLLAVEAGYRLGRLGETSPQAHQALQTSLKLLPTLARRIDLTSYDDDPSGGKKVSYTFSPDGSGILFSDSSEIRFLSVDGSSESIVFNDENRVHQELISISPQGKYIVRKNNNQNIELIEVGQPINVIRIPYDKEISRIQFSPNDQYVLITDELSNDEVWRLENGTAYQLSISLSGSAFSPDGNYVVGSFFQDQNYFKEVVRLEDSVSILSVPDIPGGSFGRDYVISDNASLFATGYSHDQGPVEVWVTANKTRLMSPPASQSTYLTDINITPDGKYLLLGNRIGEVRIWNVESSEFSQVINAEEGADWIERIEVNSQGDLMAVVVNNFVRIYEIPTGREVKRIVYRKDTEIHQATFSEDSSFLLVENRFDDYASETTKSGLDIWDISSNPLDLRDAESIVSISPDQSTLVLSKTKGDDLIELFLARLDVNKIDSIESIGDYSWIASRNLKFSRSGRYIALQSDADSISILDVSQAQFLIEIQHKSEIWNGAFDFTIEEGGIIISDSENLYFYEVSEFQKTDSRQKRTSQRISAIESNGNPEFVGFYKNHEVAIARDIANNKSLLTFWGSGDESLENLVLETNENLPQVWGFDVSPDQKMIAISGGEMNNGNNTGNGFIRIWSVESGQLIFSKNLTRPIIQIHFSPDGKHISGDSSVWMLNGIEILNFRENGSEFDIKGFVSNNLLIYEGDIDGSRIYPNFYNLDLSASSRLACERLHRNLTTEEWINYMGRRAYQRTCQNLD